MNWLPIIELDDSAVTPTVVVREGLICVEQGRHLWMFPTTRRLTDDERRKLVELVDLARRG